ncbi:MAG: hypothetical protein LBR17_05365 [Bacteroidales bacterium]|jgi:hypothetical protein|nr:hypothetical protein [Bacteroidales bacterium]
MGKIELLIDKEIAFTSGNPMEILLKKEGVVEVDYYDMTSSAGRWMGIFVQKYEDKYHLINFWQEICFGEGENYIYTDDHVSAIFSDINDYEEVKMQHYMYLDDLCSLEFDDANDILEDNTKKETENTQMSLFDE